LGKWLVRLLLLCVLTSVAWAGWHALGGKSATDVRTTTPVRGPLSLAVTATGKLAPTTEVLVGSEVSGTVEEVLVSFNDRIKRGQVIARIKPEFYQAEHDQAQAELAKATAQLQQLEVQERDAKREYDRVVHLRESGAASEQEFDVRLTAYEAAKASTAVGRAAVQAALSQVQLTRYRLERAAIVSPIDGIVLDRRIDVGQTVAAALQSPVLFVLAEDLRQMDLLADVSEADVGYITAGQPVTFTVNAYREQTFSGRVRQVRNQPHTIGDVVTYQVVISVANEKYLFRPGMPADVSIQIVQQDDVIKIANAALRFRPPLPTETIRRELEQLTWPARPEPVQVLGSEPTASGPGEARVPPPLEPVKATLWQFIDGVWKPVPVWTLYTDNRETALHPAGLAGEEMAFVTELGKEDAGRNTLQQAFYLARPENRKL